MCWTRINGKNFGCAVDFELLMGARGPKIVTECTSIRRQIRHHLDHSVRPQVHTPGSGMEGFYVGSDCLKPSALHHPVVFPTHFTASGWGIRCLTPEELSVCFGIDDWKLPNEVKPFPPLAPLEHHLSKIVETDDLLVPSSSPKLDLEPVTRASQEVWISVGGKYIAEGHWEFDGTTGFYLPPSWMEVTFDVVKAAKADNADIPKSLWNR